MFNIVDLSDTSALGACSLIVEIYGVIYKVSNWTTSNFFWERIYSNWLRKAPEVKLYVIGLLAK